MSITSDEVNYLVYRYLLESGFIHSAFSFGHESLISKATIDGSKVSPGALISFVQKGLQFAEIEAHINDDGTETICNNSFSATQPHKCSARSKRRIFDPYAAEFEGGGFGELEAASADVMRLKGHSKIASACAWHPRRPILASGSGDATTRLWEFASGGSSDAKDSSGAAAAGPGATSTKILPMAESGAGSGSGDRSEARDMAPPSAMVVSLGWSRDGSQLAAGSYSGRAYIWDANGQLKHTLSGHSAPLASLRWSKDGSKLLTGGFDATTIVWDATSGALMGKYVGPKGAITSVDWRSDCKMFAVGSVDHSVTVWDVENKSTPSAAMNGAMAQTETPEPRARLDGHASEVNQVQWGPGVQGLLASCSDDATVKLWNATSKECVQTLTNHTREVGCLNWSKAGSLATGSLDSTVRVWDTEEGKCVSTFVKHFHPVSSVVFSPSGDMVASASHDRMYVWSVKDDVLVKTVRVDSGVNDLSWDSTGRRLAGACANGDVRVLNLRM